MGFSFCYFRKILNRFSWDFHRYRIGLSLDGFRLILKRMFIGFLVDFRWTMFGRFRICLHRIFMGFSLGFSLHFRCEPAAGRGYPEILEGLEGFRLCQCVYTPEGRRSWRISHRDRAALRAGIQHTCRMETGTTQVCIIVTGSENP